jgi:5-methylcytosine-specific restriction protein A
MVTRLPAEELQKVTAEHIWNAVQKLSAGFKEHPFKESTGYDLIADTRLDPKAVFGVAATEALGFEVLPGHFSGGVGTPCFRALHDAGYLILPKGQASAVEASPLPPEDGEWAEGQPVLITHLRRERAAGLAAAKKARFVREHGKLFCEHCRLDPIAMYGEHGDACIDVHHETTHVTDMTEAHQTRLEDLRCLCANCHRVEHRRLRHALKTRLPA